MNARPQRKAPNEEGLAEGRGIRQIPLADAVPGGGERIPGVEALGHRIGADGFAVLFDRGAHASVGDVLREARVPDAAVVVAHAGAGARMNEAPADIEICSAHTQEIVEVMEYLERADDDTRAEGEHCSDGEAREVSGVDIFAGEIFVEVAQGGANESQYVFALTDELL